MRYFTQTRAKTLFLCFRLLLVDGKYVSVYWPNHKYSCFIYFLLIICLSSPEHTWKNFEDSNLDRKNHLARSSLFFLFACITLPRSWFLIKHLPGQLRHVSSCSSWARLLHVMPSKPVPVPSTTKTLCACCFNDKARRPSSFVVWQWDSSMSTSTSSSSTSNGWQRVCQADGAGGCTQTEYCNEVKVGH